MNEKTTFLISFSQKRPALAFSDYLHSLGIRNQIETVDDGFAIQLADAGQLEQAKAEAQAFIENPNDPRFWQASWQTGQIGQNDVYDAQTNTNTGFRAWWKKGGPVTRIVTLICLLVYGALALGGEDVFQALNFPEAISIKAIQGEWWRLLTPAFLHFGLLHIAFNLLWWWELGGTIERMQSSGRLLGLTLVIALVSNAVQFLSYGNSFGGLSAVVYGALGYLWIYPYMDPSAGYRINNILVMFMLGWLVLGYTHILEPIFGKISNDGHLSGLVVGVGLAILLGLVNRKPAVQPG